MSRGESAGLNDYDAFMSYSHTADGALAPAVQHAIQRIGKPWYKRSVVRVFRDDTGLTAGPGLWSAIEDAMDRSEWFILLSSPEASRSAWVGREIEHWIAKNGVDRILPVVTSGSWVWDPAVGDFDMERSSAVHPALRGVFREEPRHVDLSWTHSQRRFSLAHRAFRSTIADIAAPLHRMPKEDLESEDLRQRRRSRAVARAGVASLAILLVVSGIATVMAVGGQREAVRQSEVAAQRADEAQRERDTAEQLALTATAHSLAAASTDNTDLDESLRYLLAAYAFRLDPSDTTRSAVLSRSVEPTIIDRRLVGHQRTVSAAFNSESDRLALADAESDVWIWDLMELTPPAVLRGAGSAVTFTGGGDLVTISGATINWIDPQTSATDVTRIMDLPLVALAGLPDGSVVVADEIGQVSIVGKDGEVTRLDLPGPGPDPTSDLSGIFLGASDGGTRIVAATDDRSAGTTGNHVWVWDGAGKPLAHWLTEYRLGSLARDGSVVALAGVDIGDRDFTYARVSRTDTGEEVGNVRVGYGLVFPMDIELLPFDRGLLAGNYGTDFGDTIFAAVPYEDDTGRRTRWPVEFDFDGVRKLAVSPNGLHWFVGGHDESYLLESPYESIAHGGPLVSPEYQLVPPMLNSAGSDTLLARRGRDVGTLSEGRFAPAGFDHSGLVALSSDATVALTDDGRAIDVASGGVIASGLPRFSSLTEVHPVVLGPRTLFAYPTAERDGSLAIVDPSTGLAELLPHVVPCEMWGCIADVAVAVDGSAVALRSVRYENGPAQLHVWYVEEDGTSVRRGPSSTSDRGGPIAFDPRTGDLLVAEGHTIRRLLRSDLTDAEPLMSDTSVSDWLYSRWQFNTAGTLLAEMTGCTVIVRSAASFRRLVELPTDAEWNDGGCQDMLDLRWNSAGSALSILSQHCESEAVDLRCRGLHFDFDEQRLLERMCKLAGRELSAEERALYLAGLDVDLACPMFE